MVTISPSWLFKDKKTLLSFADVTNRTYRVHIAGLSNYAQLVKNYRNSKSYSEFISNPKNIDLAYDTLIDWNMDQRRAKLQPRSVVQQSVSSHAAEFEKLNRYRMETYDHSQFDEVYPALRDLFVSLNIMSTRANIVGNSKIMHFLLPDLVMPIDRGNVIDLLYLGSRYSSSATKEFKVFWDIFQEYNSLCVKLGLSPSDFTHQKWNTSIPKLIDNAIIGFQTEFKHGNVKITYSPQNKEA